MEKFIRTKDYNTSLLLLKLGFEKINESNGLYTFMNSSKLCFSNDVDTSKIQYTNILTF